MSFLYSCPVGLIEFDTTGRMSLVNPHAMNLLIPLATDRDATNLFHLMERHATDLRTAVAAFSADHGTIHDGYRINIDPGDARRGARPQVLSISIKRLGPDRYMATLSNITSQVEQEERLAQAEAANKAKTDFIGVLSHELRTPLTVILGVARLANSARLLKSSKTLLAALESNDRSPAEIRTLLDDVFAQLSDLMERMVKSGEHLLHLINEMLDSAKIESGNLSVACEICDIKDIADPVIYQLRTLAQEKGLSFEVTQDAVTVFADKVRTRQILFNLVGNAIKFTDQGFVRLMIKTEAETVVFEIQDSGAGIYEVEFNSIFEAFYQIDSSAVRRAGGTGMGLSISRNLAEMQGGSLNVTSTVGEGSCFRLTLPASREGGGEATGKLSELVTSL
ncbi:hypothetical protein GLR48_20995 [Loktanella sp. M215]|nr:hypothetical protein [Loktanella sp. M215]